MKNNKTESQRKHYAQFEGSYVYLINERFTQRIVYVGETSNIVRRYYAYFNSSHDTGSFNQWCIETGRDKKGFEVAVLDLTPYETLDMDDRLIVEKALIMCHANTVVNKDKPQSLNAYEMERYEYITSIVEPEFKPYTQIKVEKMAKKIA